MILRVRALAICPLFRRDHLRPRALAMHLIKFWSMRAPRAWFIATGVRCSRRDCSEFISECNLAMEDTRSVIIVSAYIFFISIFVTITQTLNEVGSSFTLNAKTVRYKITKNISFCYVKRIYEDTENTFVSSCLSIIYYMYIYLYFSCGPMHYLRWCICIPNNLCSVRGLSIVIKAVKRERNILYTTRTKKIDSSWR